MHVFSLRLAFALVLVMGMMNCTGKDPYDSEDCTSTPETLNGTACASESSTCSWPTNCYSIYSTKGHGASHKYTCHHCSYEYNCIWVKDVATRQWDLIDMNRPLPSVGSNFTNDLEGACNVCAAYGGHNNTRPQFASIVNESGAPSGQCSNATGNSVSGQFIWGYADCNNERGSCWDKVAACADVDATCWDFCKKWKNDDNSFDACKEGVKICANAGYTDRTNFAACASCAATLPATSDKTQVDRNTNACIIHLQACSKEKMCLLRIAQGLGDCRHPRTPQLLPVNSACNDEKLSTYTSKVTACKAIDASCWDLCEQWKSDDGAFNACKAGVKTCANADYTDRTNFAICASCAATLPATSDENHVDRNTNACILRMRACGGQQACLFSAAQGQLN